MGLCTSAERDVAQQYRGKADAWFKREAEGTKPADCFYLHPTTEAGMTVWNIAYDNYSKGDKITGMAAGTPDLLDTQAGCMAETCNLWAPRYSQIGMMSLGYPSPTCSEKKQASYMAALEIALADATAAFAAFLEERPDKERPFFILAHSQGSILMTKVIKDKLCGTPAQKQFVAAYLAGGYIPEDVIDLLQATPEGMTEPMHICKGPEDTNCIISWDTRLKEVYVPDKMHDGMLGLWPHYSYWYMFDKYGAEETRRDPESKPRIQINPITWQKSDGPGDSTYMGAKQYASDDPIMPPNAEFEGSIGVTTGHCLWIADPRSWTKEVGPAAGEGNLHPVDVSFWYYNIKSNVAKRLEAFKA